MGFEDVTAVDLHDWIEANEVVLIDVREPMEFQAARLEGAVLYPLGQIEAKDIPTTDLKLVIYCKSGYRSQVACEQLREAGISAPLYNLEGGIVAWYQAGFPIVTGDGNSAA